MTKISTDQTQINELLTRSVDTIYPSKEALAKALTSGKQLTVYFGIDPTASSLHLGHSVGLIILRRFHELGHKVIALTGDFTGMIGDPSDKTAARVRLSRDQIEANLKTYKSQIGKILNFEDKSTPVEFKFNSTWLSKLTFADLIDLASNFTVQQMIERDAFQKRLADKKPLFVHEFFYPLMQGYDSVAMNVDGEVGGTDQTFNMLAGRNLLKRLKNKDKFVIAYKLLEDPATGQKLMSKSDGTGVSMDDDPANMYAAVMRLPDSAIMPVFESCTLVDMAEIDDIRQELKATSNPRDIKARLAAEIVGMYHSESAAKAAASAFDKQFKDGEQPADIPSIKIKTGERELAEVLVEAKLAASKSDAKRLIDQGGARLNGEVVKHPRVDIKSGDVIQVGKRHFAKIK